MTMDIATLGIRIDSLEARQRLQELAVAGDGTTKSLTATERASQRASGQFNAMAGMAKIAAGAIAGIAFGKVIQEVASFESKLLTLRSLTNANTSEMKSMEKQARSLGATTAFSAQQTAEAQGVLASAGLKVNEILAATPKVLQLAAAGNIELAKAAEISTGTMKGLGLELTDLGRINDVFAKVAADTSTNVEQVGEAMKNVAPIAQAFGINLEDMGAALGILADNQIKGSEAGNNFKAMLVALGNETKERTVMLKQHGLSYADLNVQVKGLQPVMDSLRKANLSGAEAITLFGSDAAAAGLILSNNAGKIDTFSTALEGAAGSAQKQSEILNQGLSKAWDAFLGTLSEAALQFGDVQNNSHTLKEELTGLIVSVTGVIAIYEGMGREFADSNNLTKEQYTNLKNIASGLETVAAGAGGIAILTAGIWAANTAMLAFNLASKANPIVLLGTLGVAGIGMVIDKIGQQKKAQEDFMTSANTLEDQNLKIKTQIAKIVSLAPHGGGTGASKETMDIEKKNLEILIGQRTAIEAKTAAEKESVKVTEQANKNKPKEQPKLSGTSIEELKAQEKAAKAAAKEQAALAKSFEDTVTSLSLHNIELSKTPRELEEATLVSKKFTKAQIEQLMAISDIGVALEAKKKLHEDEKAQLDSLIDRYNKATMSARDYYSSTLTVTSPDGIKSPMSGADKAPLLSQFDKTSKAELDKKSIDDAKTALDAYNSSLDSANVKTSDLGAVTSAIFDGALAGINGMAGAFDSMVNSINATTEALTKNAEAQALNNANPDSPEKAANAKKYAQVELDLNDKVLSAKLKAGSQIAGFLSSSLKKGSTEQKAAHAIQMALAGAELAMNLMKLLGIGTVTAAETASVLPSVAASTAKGTAKASEAVATQASAGPYIGFALMAAMAAAMAAIGFATGGGGGSSSGPPPSNSDNGTGTVLGDPAAVSESIGHTNDLLKSIHADEYIELRGINKGIQTLQGNILSAVTKEFQLGSLTGSNAPNLGKSGHTMVAGGMQTAAIALSEIMAGMEVVGQMYTTDAVKKTSKGKTSFTYQDFFSPMDKSLNESLTKVFKSIGKVMSETASVIGKDIGVDFSQKISDSVIPALKIDTMGLSGDEAVKKANAVISSMLDKLSMAVFGDVLKQYQQLGEGMLETTIRLVAEIAIVKDALHQSSLSLTTDVVAVSDALVQAAGGLEEFKKQFEAFYDKFYTDAEKQARLAERLYGTFIELFPESTIKFMGEARDNYRKVIEALDMSTQSGQAQYSMLIELASASDTYYAGLEAAAKAANAGLEAAAKAAMDTLTKSVSSAMSVLQKSVAAEKTALTKKYNDNIASTQLVITNLTTAVTKLTSLSNMLKNSLKGMSVAGSESTNRTTAQAFIADALRMAQAGQAGSIDETQLNDALGVVAKPSELLFATFEDYQRDFLKTAIDISNLSDETASQTSKAVSQLDVAKSQLEAIKDGYAAENLRLDDLIKTAQDQIDAVNGTTVAVMTVSAALASLSANLSVLNARQNPVESMYQNFLGRASDQSGKDFWNNSIANGSTINDTAAGFVKSKEFTANAMATGDPVASLYSTLLGRKPDEAGYNFWNTSLNNGQSIADIATAMMDSPEYAKIKAVRGYASGGYHEGGWRMVGEKGPELENTGASRIYSHGQSKSLLDTSELVAEVKALREEIRAGQAVIANNTKATTKILRDVTQNGTSISTVAA